MIDSIIQDIQKIRVILKSFKKTDFHSDTSFYNCLNGFPAGCCGDTTTLLGLFLTNEHKKSCTYVSAKGLGKYKDLSHAWLVCDGYIIDITADQFNSKGYDLEPVIISKESSFHTQFIQRKLHEINAEKLLGDPVFSVYTKVLLQMRQDK